MTAIDPIPLLKQILNDYGHSDVNYDGKIESRALSADEYIFLEQVGGVTRHTESSYRVTIQIVLYAREANGDRASFRKHSKVQSDLRKAWGKKYPLGGIHRMINRLSPQRQDIPGLPYGIGRTVSQHDFVLRTSEGWA